MGLFGCFFGKNSKNDGVEDADLEGTIAELTSKQTNRKSGQGGTDGNEEADKKGKRAQRPSLARSEMDFGSNPMFNNNRDQGKVKRNPAFGMESNGGGDGADDGGGDGADEAIMGFGEEPSEMMRSPSPSPSPNSNVNRTNSNSTVWQKPSVHGQDGRPTLNEEPEKELTEEEKKREARKLKLAASREKRKHEEEAKLLAFLEIIDNLDEV